MKGSSFVAAALLGLTALASAASAQDYPQDTAALYEAAKKEGALTWYIGAPLAQMTDMAAEFEKAYPGIKIDIQRIVGVQQYQKFMEETEAERHIADVLQITDQPSMIALIQDGHIAEWKVPTNDLFPKGFRIQTHSYAQYPFDSVIMYNTTKVSEEEAKILATGWRGVLDPRFKERIAVTNQKCGGCYAPVHMLVGPEMQAEYGWNYLKALAEQKPAVYPDIVVAIDRVIAGERGILWVVAESAAFANWQKGAPVRWVRPSPGPFYGNSWQAISKYAPHPNAARLFQNWAMSKEGAYAMQMTYGAASALKGIDDIRPVTKEPWYQPPRDPYTVDFERWARDFDKDWNTWTKMLQATTGR